MSEPSAASGRRPPVCPRCPAPVAPTGRPGEWSCPDHGLVPPLWRPREATYDDFVEHLRTAASFPTLLPWPMIPGWSVTDFAVVGAPGAGRAALTCTSGTSELDGPVDLIVVTEEAGTGLGARVAGLLPREDPGAEVGDGPPAVRVRVDRLTVPLWTVSISAGDGDWDRSVLAGEADGRWLWVVLRPASAILLLHDDLILRDVSDLGPPLLELPFGGPAPPW